MKTKPGPKPKAELTARQATIYRVIVRYFAKHGFAPAFRDIMAVEPMQLNGVRSHLKALRRKGWLLDNEGSFSRNIVPVDLATAIVAEAGKLLKGAA